MARAPRLCFNVVFKEDENAYKGNYEDGNNSEAPRGHETSHFQDAEPDDGDYTGNDPVDTINDRALNEGL